MSQLYSRFLYVYDDHLAFYLNSKGHRFITHARHIVTGREFFQYDNTEQIREDMEHYTQQKLLRLKGDNI
jgi:thermostable 8-oxoguanine DNA glycosylase